AAPAPPWAPWCRQGALPLDDGQEPVALAAKILDGALELGDQGVARGSWCSSRRRLDVRLGAQLVQALQLRRLDQPRAGCCVLAGRQLSGLDLPAERAAIAPGAARGLA